MVSRLALFLFLSFFWVTSQAQVLVYTGTFDPPHDGHKEVLLQGMDRVQPKVTLVNPGPTDHKSEARPLELRMQMTEAYFFEIPGVDYPAREVQELFWDRQDQKAMERLAEIYPGEELFRVVGTDRMAWETAESVKQSRYKFLVSARPGDAPLSAELQRLVGSRIFFLPEPSLSVSSSQIRNSMIDGVRSEFMDQRVFDMFTRAPQGFRIRCTAFFN